MPTPSTRVILRELKDPDGYVTRFDAAQQSAAFEQLVANALANILYLPFYASNNDDGRIPNRVVWFGSTSPLSKAAANKPDAIGYCCDFHIVVEATRKTGSSQWSQEFAQSIRHCEDFCTSSNTSLRDAYVLLICTQLHVDTYRSIKNHPRQECRLVPLEVADVAGILQTSILAFTLRHVELRCLLNSICGAIVASPSLADFRRSVTDTMAEWQRDVLRLEKTVFVGVKSYEAMRRIGRQHIGATEILQRLQKHPVVNQYFKLIGDKVGADGITEALITHSFAARLGATYAGEQLFQPVSPVDFKQRSLRLIHAVEEA
jgi:hypothetical protein